jgi:hypothetical protein
MLCNVCHGHYAVTEARCPHCLTANPQVEQVDIPGKLRYSPASTATQQLCTHEGSTGTAIASIQSSVGTMFPYTMQGSMKATTTVRLRGGAFKSFDTKNNMHSEMAALHYMLESGEWKLYLGQVTWAHDGAAIGGGDFQTAEPHCRFCTVMLQVLGLPHGKPTKGNYNYACNFNYPLPAKVRDDPYVLARVLGGSYCAFSNIKCVLNSFVTVRPETWLLEITDGVVVNDHHYVPSDTQGLRLTWAEVVQKDMLTKIWAMIFKAIYEAN